MRRPARILILAVSVAALMVVASLLMYPGTGKAQGRSPFNRLFEEHARLFGELAGIVTRLDLILEALKPDLVPLEQFPDIPPPSSFCKIDNGSVIVTVANQGSLVAGETTTRVTFSTPQQTPTSVDVDVLTPEIPAGEGGEVELAFPIPFGCFAPDCFFTITVDVFNDVTEQSGTNNTAVGLCLG